MEIEVKKLEELPFAVSEFLKAAGTRRHFAVYGPMGVGKTTFIKEVCHQLEVLQVVTSPTFALVNEYSTAQGGKVYHFDFYRIKKQEELYDLGYEDYLYAKEFCFIEWPELAEELIPAHFVKIYIQELATGSRRIEAKFK